MLHFEVKDLVSLKTMFESDSHETPLILEEYWGFGLSRYFYEGYAFGGGITIHQRKVDSIKGYELSEDGESVRLMFESEPIGKFTT